MGLWSVLTSALGRTAKPRRVVRFIAGPTPGDCGPAAIAMTLSYYEHPTTLDEARAELGFDDAPALPLGRAASPGEAWRVDDCNAHELVTLAKARGLGATGIRGDADYVLPSLRPGDILHFDSRTFVVFQARTLDGVRFIDPAHGSCLVSHAAFPVRFASGVALLFARTPWALKRRMLGIRLDNMMQPDHFGYP